MTRVVIAIVIAVAEVVPMSGLIALVIPIAAIPLTWIIASIVWSHHPSEDRQTSVPPMRPPPHFGAAESDDGKITRMPTTEKQKAIEALQSLPDDATIDDAIERLCFIAKIEEGLRPIGCAPARAA